MGRIEIVASAFFEISPRASNVQILQRKILARPGAILGAKLGSEKYRGK